MSVLIAGIQRRCFPNGNQGFESFVKLMHPVSDVKNDKIVIEAVGLTTDIPFGKQDLRINDAYAQKLIDKRAFVPLRNYDVVTQLNPDSLQTEVTELKPVDDDVKKFMSEALK